MAHDLIIIGGGAAGLGAARAAARAGAKPLLVADGPIGGDCTWTGCVPSKTLIAQSKAGTTFRDAISTVHTTIEQVAAAESIDVLRAEGIDVIEGRAALASPTSVVVDGATYTGSNIVVATGARASIPPIAGLADVDYLTNETLFELTELPARFGVIGGGAIGCEMAMAFAGFGSAVSIFEGADRLLPVEEPEASAAIKRAMATAGVSTHVGSPVTNVCQSNSEITVDVGGSSVVVDALLVATGRTANTSDLGLEETGVAVDDAGHVIVDEKLTTSVKTIRAAGDVTGLLPFTHSADEQARMAVAHALKTGARWKYDVSSTPWVTFTTPEVARVGVAEANAPKGARVAHLPLRYVDRAITDGRTDGFVKLIAAPKGLTRNFAGGRLVGATIVAERAGEMIHGPTMAMRLSMFVGRLAQVTVAYPTYTTAIQQAAGMFFQPMHGLEARPATRV